MRDRVPRMLKHHQVGKIQICSDNLFFTGLYGEKYFFEFFSKTKNQFGVQDIICVKAKPTGCVNLSLSNYDPLGITIRGSNSYLEILTKK